MLTLLAFATSLAHSGGLQLLLRLPISCVCPVSADHGTSLRRHRRGTIHCRAFNVTFAVPRCVIDISPWKLVRMLTCCACWKKPWLPVRFIASEGCGVQRSSGTRCSVACIRAISRASTKWRSS